MLASIALHNLGPVYDLVVTFPSPMGWTDVYAPSEMGKSFLLDAYCAALWGQDRSGRPFDPAAVHGDTDEGTAVVQTAGRSRLRCTYNMRRRVLKGARKGEACRTPSYYTSVEGGPDEKGNASDHARALAAVTNGRKSLADDPDIARLISIPQAWVPLVDGKGDGREFRNILARLAPDLDLRPTVVRLMEKQGKALLDTDRLSEKWATDRRAEKGRQVQQEKGAVRTREEEVEKVQAAQARDAGPTPEDVLEARATRDAVKAWETWTAINVEYNRLSIERGEAEARRADWQRRRDALGDRPEDHADAIGKARARRDEAVHARVAAEDAHRAARAEVDRLTAAARDAVRADQDTAHEALRKAKQDLDDARAALVAEQAKPDAEVEAAAEALRTAETVLAHANEALAELPEDHSCPTCKRAGWVDSARRRTQATADVESAKKSHDMAMVAYGEADASEAGRTTTRLAPLSDAVEAARKSLETAKADLEKAEAVKAAVAGPVVEALTDAETALTAASGTATAAQTAYEQALAMGGDAAAWDASILALGDEPVIPDEPAPLPDPPAVPRPTDEDKARAAAVARRAQDALSAGAARTEDLGALRHRLDQSRANLAAVQAEYERLDALVAALRAAPSEAIRDWIANLARDGVAVELVGTEGCRITVDGLPWHLVSRGRQVIADLVLRDILRRADGRTFLPIFVDDAQSWVAKDGSGWWPDVPGPVVRLFTAEGDLRVEAVTR